MRKILVLLVTLTCISSISFALEGKLEGKPEVKKDGPCRADAQKFCHDVTPGGGRVIKCMKEHKSELSSECQAHIEEKKEKAKDRIESCETDRQKFCSDVKGGKKRMNKCMREHKAQLSEGCRSFFK